MLSNCISLALAVALFACTTQSTPLGFEHSFPDIAFEEKEREVVTTYDVEDTCSYFGKHYDKDVYRPLVNAMFGTLKWREGVCCHVTKKSHMVHRLACHRAAVAERAGELMMAVYHARVPNMPPLWMRYAVVLGITTMIVIVFRLDRIEMAQRVANIFGFSRHVCQRKTQKRPKHK